MDICRELRSLNNHLSQLPISNDEKQSLKLVVLAYMFNNKAKDCHDTLELYELLLAFFKDHFGIFDSELLEKNSKFQTSNVLVSNQNIKDGNYEEFEVKITDEKSLVFRFLKMQIVEDIKVFNIFLEEVSLMLKNRYLQQELAEASFKDSITGLYNRAFLVEHLKKLVPLTLRNEKNLGVLMISIDHFKAVIDEFNYEIGDKVLKKLAAILMQNLRDSDLIVKYSGDEFMVILSNMSNDNDALMVAEKLVDEFAKAEVETLPGQFLKKTICAGLSMFPSDGYEIEQIFKNADIALYEAKNLGRSQVLRFEDKQISPMEFF